MPDIFISHASLDDAFVDRIHDTLEAQVKNCQAWVDHRDLGAGVNFDVRINTQLRASDYLLLVVSQNSLNSDEVGGEWRTAISNKIPILLAMIDDTPFKDLPYRLSTINAVHLKNDWDGGIAQLVKELSGETPTDTDKPLFKTALSITGTIDRRLTQTPLRGRDDDVKAIHNAPKTNPIMIIGVGGLGKSKLAAEVALTGDAWQNVIWQETGENTQVYQVIELLKQHFKLPPETERHDTLAKLRTHKTLVVLDNAEDVPPDDPRHPEFVSLVNDLLAHDAQVLLTSRVEWEVLNPVTNHDLSPLDAVAARQMVLDLGTGIKNLEAQAGAIAEAARKHPRLIEFAVGLMRRFPVDKILGELRDLTSRRVQDAMDEMIQKTLRQMITMGKGRIAEQFLKRLLVCRGGFTLAAASFLGGMDADDRDDALNELQVWQFVTYNPTTERYDLPPIVIAALTPEVSAHGSHFGYYRTLARQHDASADHEKYLKLNIESDNLEAAFEWAMLAGEYDKAYWLQNACHNFLTNRGRFEQNKNWLERVVAAINGDDAAVGDPPSRSYTNHLRASVQNSLGNLYVQHPLGERRANLHQSITAYQAALVYWTPETAPRDYAMTQNNLGVAYADLAGIEDPGENLKRAVTAFAAALVYRTPETTPRDYAMTQNNLGTVYADLARIEDPAENLKWAVAAFEAALVYYTVQVAPGEYAITQNNLGAAYQTLARIEDPAENLKQAVVAYEAALVYLTPETHSMGYATTQNNLGAAYQTLARIEELAGNLKRAVVAYEAALVYRTPQSAPGDYATTQHNLGIAYIDLGDVPAAIVCWREAEKHFRLMGYIQRADLMLEWITATESK